MSIPMLTAVGEAGDSLKDLGDDRAIIGARRFGIRTDVPRGYQ